MAEKVCCPGPIGGNNGNSAGGFREAVCVHTKKVYDSCRSKECLRDIRVYLTRDAQELINAGGIASVKAHEHALPSSTQQKGRLPTAFSSLPQLPSNLSDLLQREP